MKKQRTLCGHRKLTRGWHLRDKTQRVMLSEEFWGKEKGITGKGSSILGSREVTKQNPFEHSNSPCVWNTDELMGVGGRGLLGRENGQEPN